jgi:hypothetical protein
VIDPAPDAQAALAGIGEALDLAVEHADLAAHRVLDVGFGVAGPGGSGRLDGALRDLRELHGPESSRCAD